MIYINIIQTKVTVALFTLRLSLQLPTVESTIDPNLFIDPSLFFTPIMRDLVTKIYIRGSRAEAKKGRKVKTQFMIPEKFFSVTAS